MTDEKVLDVQWRWNGGNPSIRFLLWDGKEKRIEEMRVPNLPYMFFKTLYYQDSNTDVEADIKSLDCYTNISCGTDFRNTDGEYCFKLEAGNPYEIKDLYAKWNAKNIENYEADLSYLQRMMIDNDIQIDLPDPGDVAYFDLEVDAREGDTDVSDPQNPLMSAAIVSEDEDIVINNEGNEKETMKKVLEKLDEYPIVAGYFSRTFDWPYLKNRAENLGINFDFSRMVHFDVFSVYRYVYKINPASDSLDYVSEKEGFEGKTQKYLGAKDFYEAWKNNTEEFLEYNRQDARLTKRLSDKYEMPRIFFAMAQATYTTVPSLIKRHWIRGRSINFYRAVENLILNIAQKRDPRIVFETRDFTTSTSGSDPKFSGADVFKSIAGVHNNCAKLDYASLYPSIINDLNIGLTTMDPEGDVTGIEVNFSKDNKSIFSEAISYLNDMRQEYKDQRAEAKPGTKEYKVADAKQFAVKQISLSLPPWEPVICRIDENISVKTFKELEECNEHFEVLTVDSDYSVVFKEAELIKHRNKFDYFQISKNRFGSVIVTPNHSLINKDLDTTMPGDGDDLISFLDISKFDDDREGEIDLLDILEEYNPYIILPNASEEIGLYNPKIDKYVKRFKFIDKNKECKSKEVPGECFRWIVKNIEKGYIDSHVFNGQKVKHHKLSLTEEGKTLLEKLKILKNECKDYGENRNCNMLRYKSIDRGDLEVFDDIKIKIGKCERHEFNAKIDLDEKIARFLGLYVAEGCANEMGAIFISARDKSKIKDKIVNDFAQKFNLSVNKNEQGYSISSLTLNKMLKKICGNGAKNKKVPEDVINSNNDIRKAFMYGYWIGDGYKNYNEYEISSISRKLLGGLALMSKIMGFPYSTVQRTDSRYGDSYRERMLISNLKIDQENMTLKSKDVDYKRYYKEDTKKDCVFSKEKELFKIKESPEYVYDLKVKDTHRFFAGNFMLCHNSTWGAIGYSDGRFFDRKISNEITGAARYVMNKLKEFLEQHKGHTVITGDTDSSTVRLDGVDNNYIEYLENLAKEATEYVRKAYKEKYNLDETTLELEFEKLYDRFFISDAKKKYAGRVVYEEGEHCMYIEKVGLEAIRGDWPKGSKEFQEKMIKFKLSNKDLKEIRNYVKGIRKKVLRGEWDDKLVVWKGMNKKIDDYKQTNPARETALIANENGFNYEQGDKIPFIKYGDNTDDVIHCPQGNVDSSKLTRGMRKYIWKKKFVPIMERMGFGDVLQTSLTEFP